MAAMPALFIFSLTSGLLAILGTAAFVWGTDSPPSVGDDHVR
jgi:hypothetical protein